MKDQRSVEEGSMCLAVPLRITEVNGSVGMGEQNGVKRSVRLELLKDPKPGDYVIVHAGYAIERLREEQALPDIEAFRELEEAIRELKNH